MSDAFVEVQEAMRQERLITFWSRYGNLIIGLILLLIVATAALSVYRGWNRSVQQEQTAEVLRLLEDEAFPDNLDIEALEIRPNLKNILMMQAAAKSVEAEDTQAAIEYYQSVAALGQGDSSYRYLSLLMLGRLDKQADLREVLAPVLKDKKNIWRPYALLDLAAYEAETHQNYDDAMAKLDEVLAIDGAARSLYEKARSLRYVYELRKNAAS